jgi:hypothetical protein
MGISMAIIDDYRINKVRSIVLGEYLDEPLCPVRTLLAFIQQTAIIRERLPIDHALFLTYSEKEDMASFSIRPTIVISWIKSAIQAVEINTT